MQIPLNIRPEGETMNETNDIEQRVLMLERELIHVLEALTELTKRTAGVDGEETTRWRINAEAEIAVLELVVEALISNHPNLAAVKGVFDQVLIRDLDNFVEIGFVDRLPVESAREVKERMNHHAWMWRKRLER